ncbi:PAAR domain-containing protein [Glaciimonas soli]|uniref:PAAR domain-containing protein n=1 Tax=Glaciimonas soli TaxID=2590999 RepID=A0A843YWL3_9BURK|nr:PAAR domain-containing protein [Glaciimonas soli]MQR00966.1 hypothetical protein [Glaciimonas soli]
MSAYAIVRQGDSTSHGGTVHEGFNFPLYGRNIAGVGHKGFCPQCNCEFTIIGGSGSDLTVLGMTVAVEGMLTSCGAYLIASQHVATIGGIPSGVPAQTPFASSNASNYAEAKAQKYDEQIRAIDHETGSIIPNIAYFIKTNDGEIYNGYTDDFGLCPRVYTDQTEPLSVWFGFTAIDMQLEKNNGG